MASDDEAFEPFLGSAHLLTGVTEGEVTIGRGHRDGGVLVTEGVDHRSAHVDRRRANGGGVSDAGEDVDAGNQVAGLWCGADSMGGEALGEVLLPGRALRAERQAE